MPKARQLAVRCANRPGTLARLAGVLGDARVNILAFRAETTGAQGVVRLIVSNPAKARKALGRQGMSCTEEAVLHVELPNVPGALGKLAGKLAARKINITSGYQTAAKGAKRAGVVLAVSNLGKAARVR